MRGLYWKYAFIRIARNFLHSLQSIVSSCVVVDVIVALKKTAKLLKSYNNYYNYYILPNLRVQQCKYVVPYHFEVVGRDIFDHIVVYSALK